MVRDANEDPEFIRKFKDKIREHPKPPFSMIRFSGAFMVAYLFGQLIMIAIPEYDFGGINWSFLHWLIPFGVSLGMATKLCEHCLYIKLFKRHYFLLRSYRYLDSGQFGP